MKMNKLTLNNKLKLGIIINCSFTIIEFALGFFSGSLALISDACHNLTDVISLVISFFAHTVSQKKPSSNKTFGYGRITILAALINATGLVILALYIFKEAYLRFSNPEAVESFMVILTGLAGIIVNGGVASLFFKYRHNLNVKAALINMIFDTLASAGALISGIVITFTGKTIVDPLISMAISFMLLFSAFKILKEVFNILLEGVPTNINIKDIKTAIKNVEEVIALEDLHIWAISSEYSALSCHLIINKAKLQESTEIRKKIRKKLEKFPITHTTLEIDYVTCQNKICNFVDSKT